MNAPDPLPPALPPVAPFSTLPQAREVQEIEDPVLGLSLQFIVAMMLTNGQAEVTISRAMLTQAMDKLITARQTEDGGFVVRLFKD
jgi:hypothetical protein